MKTKLTLHGVLISILCLITSRTDAQVFIADSAFRAVLNQAIPGLVDNVGVMDTLHPGIAEADSLDLAIGTAATSLDLGALAYLDSLRYLFVYGTNVNPNPLDMLLPSLPGLLDNLRIASTSGDMEIGDLPAQMSKLYLSYDGYDTSSAIHLAGMPEYLDDLTIYGNHVTWDGIAHAENVSWSGGVFGHCVLPPLEASYLTIYGMQGEEVDLSNVQVSQLSVSMSCGITGSINWPTGVTRLHYINAFGNLTAVTAWSPALDSLIFNDMTGMPVCIPVLPAGLSYLEIGSPLPCIPNWPDLLESYYDYSTGETIYASNANYCSVLNSTCPGGNPGISGSMLIDVNGNGQCDPGEPPLPQASVVFQPNGNIVGCDTDGSWEIGVQTGNYTIASSSSYPYIQSMSPTEHTANVPNMIEADTQNDFAVTLMPDIEDLRAQFYSEPARPGFENRLYLTCQNYGTVPMDAQLTLTYDADQTWVGSSTAPNTQSGNTATWNFTGLAIGASQMITVDLNTAASVPLGTSIAHLITASPTSGDETPLDNEILFVDSVVGSFDPNDKLLIPASMSPDQVQSGTKRITYTIRFQNTGTYLAERVLILDTLPEGLQPQSIEFLSSSHTNHWYVLDGVLHVLHTGINLPDSTSDEANSHGFIRFSILPDADLNDGETVTNIAHIVFDFNAPIITPPAVFTVDVEAGLPESSGGAGMLVSPNPAHDRIQLHSDRSAVISYRIFNALGAQVKSGSAAVNGWVNVEALPAGVYVLEAEQNGLRSSHRFIKQ